MPIIKSAKKRVRVAEKATIRNRKTKRSLKTALRAFQTAVTSGANAKINTSHIEAQRAIDIAVKKNIIHKNKAARKKAKLAKDMKASGAKIAKKTTAKTAAKTTTSKPVTKKPIAKKTPAKKKAKTSKK